MKFGSAGARVFLPPATVASTATAQMTFDTSGYDDATIDLELGTQTTTNGQYATIKFLESDDTVVTNFTAITALTGGSTGNTSGNFVIPAMASLGLGGAIQFQIDLRTRKRYLQLQVTPGTSGSVVMGVNGQLSRAEQLPVTAAQKSVTDRDATNAAVFAIVQVN